VDIGEQSEALSVAVNTFSLFYLTLGDEPVLTVGQFVSGNFFDVLGVSAERGRAFTPSDDEPSSAPVIVLSHRAWVQHFAGDPGVPVPTVGSTPGVSSGTRTGQPLTNAPPAWSLPSGWTA